MYPPSLQDICSSIRLLWKSYYVPGIALEAGEQQRRRVCNLLRRRGPQAVAVQCAKYCGRVMVECYGETHQEHEAKTCLLSASFLRAEGERLSRDP